MYFQLLNIVSSGQPLALISHAHSQPSQDCYRQRTSRQFSREFGGQVTKIDLARRQCVESRDRAILLEQDFRGGESLVLMLQRLGVQPIIDLALTAFKWTAWVTSL